jgi:hypothetical protein
MFYRTLPCHTFLLGPVMSRRQFLEERRAREMVQLQRDMVNVVRMMLHHYRISGKRVGNTPAILAKGSIMSTP